MSFVDEELIMTAVNRDLHRLITSDEIGDDEAVGRIMERMIDSLSKVGHDRKSAISTISRMSEQEWSNRTRARFANC